MINASIVLYKHTPGEIAPLVNMLRASGVVSAIYLIDNSPVEDTGFHDIDAVYVFNGVNLGYGAAHNISIRISIEEQVPYHLVVNPDISFDPDILNKMVNFMNKNSKIGHLMPKILYPTGEIQYLCKLLPTPFDLIFRRFLPDSWTHKRNERLELRNSGYDHVMDVPYLSGCFMFIRTSVLEDVGLFDERFFMYPEDIDLTRRIHVKYRTVFYPEVHVIHHHAQGSYKNNKLLYIHLGNMIRYFNKWGWFIDKERNKINKRVLTLLEKNKLN